MFRVAASVNSFLRLGVRRSVSRLPLLALIALSGLSAPIAAFAQATCDGDIYLSQGTPTNLLHSSTVPIAFTTAANSAGTYNALGRNPTDGELYAIASTGDLLRVGKDGVTVSLGAVTGLASTATGGQYYAGGFSTSGIYYVKKQGTGDTIYAIDVLASQLMATPITLSQALLISDMAWVGGLMYTSDDNGQLYSIDVASGAATDIGTPDNNGGVFGAQFSGTNGLFGVSNSGAGFFRIDLATGAREFISNAPNSSLNDGASCPNAVLLQVPPEEADVQITKDDGVDRYTPGANLIYTIKVKNNGPTVANGVTVSDPLPAGISSASWTCTVDATAPAGTACTAGGTNAIVDTKVNLPVNGSVTYTLTMAVPAAFTGTLANTATVALPLDMTDTNTANNKATDTDAPPQVDLLITKTDGVDRYTPGTPVVYTIVVTNVGPDAVTGATVSDALPSGISAASWTCAASGTGAACTGSGTNAIQDAAVNLPVNGTATYTLTMQVPAGFTGTLANTATVAVPANYIDPTPGNNTATDTDAPPQADLKITKTDGVDRYTPGKPVVYTIVVTNAGPDAVTGATVSDPLPSGISAASWTCAASGTGAACTGSGTNAIQDAAVNLPVNGTATYTLTMQVPAGFTGTLANTATVAVPANYIDPTPGNNTATDTDAPPQADLQITNTDGSPTYTPGQDVVYTVVVTNVGPDAVTGATVTNPLPAGVTTGQWTCVAGAGAACTASGTGGIQDSAVNLPPGASVTYTFTVTVPKTVSGNLVSTAQTSLPAGMTDPTPANNVATDTDTPPTAAVTPTAVPVDSPWMLLALSGLLGLFSAARAKKSKQSQRDE